MFMEIIHQTPSPSPLPSRERVLFFHTIPGRTNITNKVISMKTLIIKSLLTSLCQRKVMYPSLAKRGEGRFFNNDALLMNFLVSCL
jgi:hypothetical protein